MGTHHRTRRDDSHRRRPPGDDLDSATDEDLIVAASRAARRLGSAAQADLVSRLADRPPRRVAAELARLLEAAAALAWERGWQPADLERATARQLGGGEADLVRWAIAAQAFDYEEAGSRAAPDWMAQLDEIGARRWWDTSEPWPLQADDGWADVLERGVGVLALIETLPDLPLLAPPPGRWSRSGPVTAAGLPTDLLARIRGLLAKAEATSFDAEAETFTAKAQELMTRHRIDRAMVAEHSRRPDGEATARRVGVDDPYADPKAMLLTGIAEANGCRVVWSKGFGFATVLGEPVDLDGVEELFTSLLVQATAALRREGPKLDRRGRSRTRRFRRSFLVAFAARISQRLDEAVADTVRAIEDETGRGVVAVLDSRAAAADEALAEMFPGVGTVTVSTSDREGAFAGTRFADEADLTTTGRSVGDGDS